MASNQSISIIRSCGLVQKNELVQVHSDKLFFSRFIVIIDIRIRYRIEVYPSRSAAKLDKIRLSAAFPVSVLLPLADSFEASKAMYR